MSDNTESSIFIQNQYLYYLYVKNKDGNEYVSSKPLLCCQDNTNEKYIFQYMRDVDFMLEIENRESLEYSFFRIPKHKYKEFIQFRSQRNNQSILIYPEIEILFSITQDSKIINKRKVFGNIRGEISILYENYKIEWSAFKKRDSNHYYISIPNIIIPIHSIQTI